LNSSKYINIFYRPNAYPHTQSVYKKKLQIILLDENSSYITCTPCIADKLHGESNDLYYFHNKNHAKISIKVKTQDAYQLVIAWYCTVLHYKRNKKTNVFFLLIAQVGTRTDITTW